MRIQTLKNIVDLSYQIYALGTEDIVEVQLANNIFLQQQINETPESYASFRLRYNSVNSGILGNKAYLRILKYPRKKYTMEHTCKINSAGNLFVYHGAEKNNIGIYSTSYELQNELNFSTDNLEESMFQYSLIYDNQLCDRIELAHSLAHNIPENTEIVLTSFIFNLSTTELLKFEQDLITYRKATYGV